MTASYPSLAQKRVVVTGGASGIGAAIVDAFVAQRCEVASLDLMASDRPDVLERRCDLTDIDSLRQTIGSLGAVDVLINNAANDVRHTIEELTPESWDACQAVNLKHQFFCAQAVAPGMAERGGGTIVNMSSNAFLLANSGMAGYVTAKSAIVGLTRALARELGPRSIRVNALLPGWVMTERQLSKWVTAEDKAELRKTQCLPELISADDIAQVAVFLASAAARMITAQSIVVDGGRT